MQERRVIQHFLDFLDFLLRTTVVEQCLYLVCAYAERLGDAEQIVITGRRVLVIAAVERIFSPPVLERRVRCEDAAVLDVELFRDDRSPDGI